MSNDDSQQIADGGRAALAELGHKLVSGDLADLVVLAAKKQSGEEIIWTRSPVELLRLLTTFAEEITYGPAPDDLRSAFEAMAAHEIDTLTATLAQLHTLATTETTRRRGKQ